MSAVYLEYIYLGLDLLIGWSGRSSPSDKGGGSLKIFFSGPLGPILVKV